MSTHNERKASTSVRSTRMPTTASPVEPVSTMSSVSSHSIPHSRLTHSGLF